MRCGGRAAGPSMTTRCSPTRRPGSALARRTASAAAGAATIRLAEVRMPSRWARSTPSLMASERPKSSAVMMRRFFASAPSPRPSPSRGEGVESSGGAMALTQELEELHALAQPPLHHLRAAYHFADDRRDFRRAEIEAAIERFHRVENLA